MDQILKFYEFWATLCRYRAISLYKKEFSAIWGDSKKVFEPYPDPKNSPLGPQKVKNHPKIKSKSKVRIEGTIKNRKNSNTGVDPENFLYPGWTPKLAL